MKFVDFEFQAFIVQKIQKLGQSSRLMDAH